jgi:hypothetical protein
MDSRTRRIILFTHRFDRCLGGFCRKKDFYFKINYLKKISGVQKEFFQLAVDAMLAPEACLFVFNKETQTFWFNGWIHV